jgi:tetratricopeptide (TPR) repeat protein
MKKFTMLTALICISCLSFAQTADEENIKKMIDAQTEAIKANNADAWKAFWVQDAKTSTTFISRNGYNTRMGWDSLKASIERNFQNPLPAGTQVKSENYNIRTSGNMAWADFDMVTTPATDQSSIFPYEGANRLHHHQLLVKENDQWKIATRIVTSPDTYNVSNPDHAAETDINNAGYSLIAAKKINEAIEVFKLNVKLYPNSWNTYDSLGEAYALAGNKKMAIENYEKSIKINPKSELGPVALAKLKAK